MIPEFYTDLSALGFMEPALTYKHWAFLSRYSTGGGFHPLPSNLIQTSQSIEIWRADSLYHVLQDMLIWKHDDKK